MVLRKIAYAQVVQIQIPSVKIASLAIVKSSVTVGHFCGWQIFHLVYLPWISSQL